MDRIIHYKSLKTANAGLKMRVYKKEGDEAQTNMVFYSEYSSSESNSPCDTPKGVSIPSRPTIDQGFLENKLNQMSLNTPFSFKYDRHKFKNKLLTFSSANSTDTEDDGTDNRKAGNRRILI
jgi:hypothetical protein